MKLGDHIIVEREGYVHHGIFVGDGKVVHWAGEAEHKITGAERPIIILENLVQFGLKSQVKVITYDESIEIMDPEETVSRALHKVGMTDYNLAHNNCEHFAIWCKTGCHESTQVNMVLDWLAKIVSDMFAPA